MKLRALPQSFWQQPNIIACQGPGTICPDLCLPCKEDEINNNLQGRYIFNIFTVFSYLFMSTFIDFIKILFRQFV